MREVRIVKGAPLMYQNGVCVQGKEGGVFPATIKKKRVEVIIMEVAEVIRNVTVLSS